MARINGQAERILQSSVFSIQTFNELNDTQPHHGGQSVLLSLSEMPISPINPVIEKPRYNVEPNI